MSTPDAFRCRLCGSACSYFDSETNRDVLYTVVQCRGCHTIQICEHYDDVSPDYINLTCEELGHSHIWMNREHKHAAYRQFMGLIEPIRESAGPLVIADIGCGTGGFGEYCQRESLQYVGCDASRAQVEYAVGRGLAVVHAKTTEEFRSLAGIDLNATVVFTMWDVLEHIRDPHSFLSDVARMPFKNAYLFISVPNGGALPWKRACYALLGRRLPYLPWEHVFYYNPHSLRVLLERHGFKEERSGAVTVYPRPLSLAESLRRIGFTVLNRFASISPQIYSLATLERSSPSEGTRLIP